MKNPRNIVQRVTEIARRKRKELNPAIRERGQATAEVAITAALCLALCAGFIIFKSGIANSVNNGAIAISTMFSGLHGSSTINSSGTSGDDSGGSSSPTPSTGGAFAIYSADDKSLRFYNRSSIPSAGSSFDGRTATTVYTGITGTAGKYESNQQWGDEAPYITTVQVVDSGITPTNTSYWFGYFYSATSIDVSKLDTSNVTNMDYMFAGSASLTTLDLSNFNTENVTSMSGMFSDCESLTTLDLSNFNTENVTSMKYMFNQDTKLKQISLNKNFRWVGTDGYLPTPSSGKWYDYSYVGRTSEQIATLSQTNSWANVNGGTVTLFPTVRDAAIYYGDMNDD